MELVDQKLDELMPSAANINWLPTAATIEPREYITGILLQLFIFEITLKCIDITRYLETTLAFTDQLNGPLREEIFTRAFRRIGEAMLLLLGMRQLILTRICV